MFKVIDDKVRLSLGNWFNKEKETKHLFFDLPPIVDPETLKEVRIIPRYKARFFEIAFVYETQGETQKFKEGEFLGIDLGLDNYATCCDTNGTAFIIEGRGLKSYNRWWIRKEATFKVIMINKTLNLVIKWLISCIKERR